LREAIFNIVRERVEGAFVVDLYAGTGALGIEALSLGAKHATFIDAEARCCTAILSSIARGGFRDRAKVVRGRLPLAVTGLSEVDLILMDPPYGDESAEPTLQTLAAALAPGGLVVYEHASRYNPPERPRGLVLAERRVYGDSAIALYELQEGE
jgi:16S rRNA (guanine966-N2)-methyltransferase